MNFFLDNDVPEELSYLLEHLGHQVSRVLTCHRDDFLQLARERSHHGIVIVIRRRSRAAERAAVLRLVERAGAEGLADTINFA